jgi:hypothetical protein
MKKEEKILIRLDSSEKIGFKKAADIAGIGLSTWVRERLRLTAIQELTNAGEKIPFLNPVLLNKKDNGKKS